MRANSDRAPRKPTELLLVPVPDACELLGGVSARWLWSATKSGLIKHVQCGRRVMYRPEHLREFVESETKEVRHIDQIIKRE